MTISIHALLAESDNVKERGRKLLQISIHALLAESDAPRGRSVMLNTQFLSTLSLRRATAIATTATFNMPISIHALLAESDLCILHHLQRLLCISIHALLAESD